MQNPQRWDCLEVVDNGEAGVAVEDHVLKRTTRTRLSYVQDQYRALVVTRSFRFLPETTKSGGTGVHPHQRASQSGTRCRT
jgi:hypothetical protein